MNESTNGSANRIWNRCHPLLFFCYFLALYMLSFSLAYVFFFIFYFYSLMVSLSLVADDTYPISDSQVDMSGDPVKHAMI